MLEATPAVVLALLFGTLRALLLWRAASRADVVNVVVVSTLLEGRGRDLARVLDSSGSGAYLAVARAIGDAATRLPAGDAREARRALEREARIALGVMHKRLAAYAWLDALTLIAIGYAGVTALVGQRPTLLTTLGLVAGSLLWLSNVRGARSVSTKAYAGAMALVDTLLASLEQVRATDAGPSD